MARFSVADKGFREAQRYTNSISTFAASKVSTSQQAFNAEVEAPDFAAGGLTGATAPSRYVGATASGAPALGTFGIGDFVIDRTGKLWICTVAGSPGTWANAGSSSGVSTFNSRSGAVSPTSGDYTAAQVTNAADKSSGSQQTFSAIVGAAAFAASGLTGATTPSRYVGATVSGAPSSGTFLTGDFVLDQTARIWVCVAAGSPGTWTTVSSGAAGSTLLMPAGGTTDDSSRLQALISTNCDILLGPGTFNWNTAPVTLPPSATKIRIRGCGVGTTIIKHSATAYRTFDLNRTADYQTFQNIELADFTVDAQSITSVGQNHVVIGNMANTVYTSGQRANFKNISARRIQTVNVATDTSSITSNSRLNIWIVCLQPADNEATQNVMTDLFFEDCDFTGGGNNGITIGATTNANNQANCLYDRVTFRNCRHNTGIIPTAFNNGTSWFIGSAAYGNECRVDSCYSWGAGDDGVEIDAPQHAIVQNCMVQDSYNCGYLAMNFHPPQDINNQKWIFENCEARSISFAAGRGAAGPGGSGAYGSSYWIGSGVNSQPLGTVIMQNCSWYSKAPSLTLRGEAVFASQQPLKKIIIDGFEMTHAGISSTVSAFGSPDPPSGVMICPVGPTEIDVRRVHAHLDGNVTIATIYMALDVSNLFCTSATQYIYGLIDGVSVDTSMTASGAGSISHRLVGIGYSNSASNPPLTLRLRNLEYASVSGSDSDPYGVAVDENSASSALKQILVTDSDYTRKGGTNAHEMLVGSGHSTTVWTGNIIHQDATVKTTLSTTLP
ncbi:MAG: hypothetical protein JO246_07150 [Frankiaceae bacterium]|nr:hypothetical protein [Frankiaceae bacterium]